MKFAVVTSAGLLIGCGAAHAQGQVFHTGDTVYAAPEAPDDWDGNCVVKEGRSNRSYQVECSGTVWWVSADRIRTTPPSAHPDPMRPGQMIVPTIKPRTSASRGGTGATMRTQAAPAAHRAPQVAQVGPGHYARTNSAPQTGSYAGNMARLLAQDAKGSYTLRPGKYPCYTFSGGHLNYTFMDVLITGPNTYRSGGQTFRFHQGPGNQVVFENGPLAGHPAKLTPGPSINIGATTCDLEK